MERGLDYKSVNLVKRLVVNYLRINRVEFIINYQPRGCFGIRGRERE
jgi:hypothetical protein